ncbi:MAG: HAD-IA family hydrolase [Bacteroidaceae bacterium]|nr:HAD-IA family hydrolase [Bacteroidaceae bacterium]
MDGQHIDKQWKCLFWDLDGTITDSGEGIMKSAQVTLAHYGIEVEDWRTLRPFVGPPLEDSFQMFYGFTYEQSIEAMEIYRQDYVGNDYVLSRNFPYPGIEECLGALQDAGFLQVIATSKPKRTAEQVLKHFGLLKYFDYVAGRDAHDVLHTKADVIRDAIQRLDIHPADILMIGDRKFDILGAQELGIDSVGILWGYGDREEMERVNADYIIETISELQSFLLPSSVGK